MTFLTTTPPFDGAAILGFLAARAIPGVEHVDAGTYRRTLALPHGPATIALTPTADGVHADFTHLADPRDEPEATRRARALFGLDQGPQAVVDHLAGDPTLGPLVAAAPGRRVPGAVDGWEILLRAILGQQITVAAARTLAGRITAAVGAPIATPHAELTHLLPSPRAVADAPDEVFAMPRSRARTLREAGAADPCLVAPDDARALTDLWGIGPWTAAYVALRLGDPDVFLPTDVAILKALANRGATVTDAERWSPLRSVAVVHLWASLANPVARLPASGGVGAQTG